jgi:glucose/arabinose dehydrogenase
LEARAVGRGAAIGAALLALATAAIAERLSPAEGAPAGARPPAGDGRGGLALKPIGRFADPTDVVGPAGARGRVFVAERAGTVRMIKRGGGAKGKFLDIRRYVSCCEREHGLFSVAFAPNYSRSGRLYVMFTNRRGNVEIDEFTRSTERPARADAASRREVMEIGNRPFSSHFGGQLQFGPDGLMYVSVGDGGGHGDPFERAQSRASLHGKLLRIDPRESGRDPYTLPSSNPYVDRTGRDHIYARGLRNPWRFAFDGRRLLIADVGANRFEEVNLVSVPAAAGTNFGWDEFEGHVRYEPGRIGLHEQPIHVYSHANGRCAVIGGYVVRDPRLPRLRRRYLYADLCRGRIRSFVPYPGGARDDSPVRLPAQPGISSFGTDTRNRVYVANGSANRVYRLGPAPPPPPSP